jgi:dUTP pyrophosphatase
MQDDRHAVCFEVATVGGDPRFLPTKAHPSDAGYDLRVRALVWDSQTSEESISESYTIQPGRVVLVKTGIFLGLQPGWEAQVRPRSGLAWMHGVTIVNSPGTIDASYRGEVGVILKNGREPLTVRRFDRIAQLVIQQLPMTTLRHVEALDCTERGHGGFGHTGVQ